MSYKALSVILAGVAACCLAGGQASANSAVAHWSYHGAGGPSQWGTMSSDYAACVDGTQQSPINIANTVDADLGKIAVDYKPMPLSIVNNGHTIQVNAPKGSSVTIEGKRYELLQFHFHSPSEHAVRGRLAGLEVHFVNRAEDGSLAVLGVMIDQGLENQTLSPIWAAMPVTEGEVEQHATIEPARLLPLDEGYYRYEGSLTTPPCSEIVLWTVLKEGVGASAEQISRYHGIFGEDTNRPLQPVSRRFILSVD